MSSSRPKKPCVLICDDDLSYIQALKLVLEERFDCKSARNGDEALAVLRSSVIDVLLLDIQMRSHDEGLRYLPRFLQEEPSLPVIVVSAHTDFSVVKEAIQMGAADYVPKDFNTEDLFHTIDLALGKKTLQKKGQQAQRETRSHQSLRPLIGSSPAISRVRELIRRYQKSDANVLIVGETGSGKEIVARALRAQSSEGELTPFIAIDSATIQSSTAESTLFGHERGAFTGAERSSKGVFEEADGGIIYFDEIANMPLDIQAKLLRAIQEKEISRLGSTKTIPLRFRVVSATNRDLDTLVQEGRFLGDLLQRLNALPLELPPLRDRKEDVPLLLEHFSRLEKSADQAPLRFSSEAIEILQEHAWPGNVRELQNLVAYLSVMTDSREIDVADLPPRIREQTQVFRSQRAAESSSLPGQDFYSQVARFEKTLLWEEYRAHGSNISKLAIRLGMDRSHLHRKLKEHGIHSSRERAKEAFLEKPE